jgi:hypothetical protein
MLKWIKFVVRVSIFVQFTLDCFNSSKNINLVTQEAESVSFVLYTYNFLAL